MKPLLFLAATLACTAANAVTISTIQYETAHALFIDSESDVFDTVDVSITPGPGYTFTNNNFGAIIIVRPPGLPLTYLNEKLRGDPLDDPTFLGWSLLGRINTPTAQGFVGGPLGQTINTATQPNGDLFLANLNLSSLQGWATARVKTYRIGALVSDDTLVFPIPEPAALALAGLGSLGLVAGIRRRAE